MLGYSRFRDFLRHQHSTWMPVYVLDASFPSKYPTNGVGKAAQDDQRVWAPANQLQT